MTRRLVVAQAARDDIAGVLARSRDLFGDEAAERYRALLAAALREIALTPRAPGSRVLPGPGAEVRTRHLALTAPREVRRPRHLVVYRPHADRVDVLRVLHEAMDLPRHVDDARDEGSDPPSG